MSEPDERFTPGEVNPDGGGEYPQGPYAADPSTGGSPYATTPPPSTGGSPYAPQGPGGGAPGAMGMNIESRQQFINLGLGEVKAMVAGADPAHVKAVGENWVELRKDLVGEDWNGGIKKKFDDAVNKVLRTWHGKSANAFAKAAQKISEDFAALASHPEKVGTLLEQVSERLASAKELVDAVKEPSKVDRALDRGKDLVSSDGGKLSLLGGVPGVTVGLVAGAGRDSSGLDADLANPSITIGDAVNNNASSLSIDRERQLEAAHHVEQLSVIYRSAKEQLDADTHTRDPIKRQIPSADGNGSVPDLSPFSPPGGGPKGGPGANMPEVSGGPGYSGQNPNGINPGDIGSGPGVGGPNPGADVGTGLDGIGDGTGGLGSGGGGLGGVSGGAGAGAGGAGTGSAGGVGAVGGMPGGMAGAGSGAGGRGTGRMGGMPGMGGGAGAGAGAKGGASGRGSMARKKGGAVGAAGRAGAGAQGGSGLHRSRGGTQAGKGAGQRGAGMMGAPGARGGGAGEGKNGSERPDYLIEEEDTWTPKRNVAPRVIE